MKQNTPAFDAYMQAPNKRPRLVVELAFPIPQYLTSHFGIPGLPGPPAQILDGVLANVTTATQSLKPLEARTLIGSMSFDAIDAGGIVTDMLRSQDAGGNGLKGLTVRLWHGGEGLDFSDFSLEATQRVEGDVVDDNGKFSFRCEDILRGLRQQVFDLRSGRLSADLPAEGAGSDELTLFSDPGIEPCDHVPSFSDQPSGSFYYLELEDDGQFEVVRASGKTGTTYTGLSRGLFGTTARTWEIPEDADDDNSIEVTEYVYLELPAAAMIHAILTGNIPGGGNISSNWSRGFTAADIDLESFQSIGADLWDPNDYTKGFVLRGNALKRQDAKTFIEREIGMLASVVMRVTPDGRIGLKRIPNVGRNADYHVRLDNSVWLSHSPLKRSLAAIRNVFEIAWAWLRFPGMEAPQFRRVNTLTDIASVARYKQEILDTLSFKLLHNDRHTPSNLRSRFNALRDMKAAEPLEMTVVVPPSQGDIEVGDVVRMVDVNARDYQSTDTLDRSMLVVGRRPNLMTGEISLSLFGSSRKAGPLADDGASLGFELPDGSYDLVLLELGSLPNVNIVNGVLQNSVTVDFSASNGRAKVKVPGDFEVPAGVTLTFIGHVELWVQGVHEIAGTIRVLGGAPAGSRGYLGSTYGGRRVLIGSDVGTIGTAPGAERIEGANPAMPVLDIINNAGVIEGVPADMGGSGGGRGGGVYERSPENIWEREAVGGTGGAGGGSLVIISRGAAFGVSGAIDVSGEPGSVGQSYNDGSATYNAGSGGGGAPGCVQFLIDGVASPFPILSAGRIVARYGDSPALNGDASTRGKAFETVDLGAEVARVDFVPVSREPYPESWTNPTGEGDTGPAGLGWFATYNSAPQGSPPAAPTGDGTTGGWGPTPTSDTNWISYKNEVSILAGNWSEPLPLASNGVDGSTPVFVYRQAESQPSAPVGNPPSGWSSNPSQTSGIGPRWVSVNQIDGSGLLVGPWTSPVQWNGLDGLDGTDGITPVFVYKQRPTRPATPTGNPPGDDWYYDPFLVVGSGPTWVATNGEDGQGVLVGPYSTPVQWNGRDGIDGDPGVTGDTGNVPIFVFTRSQTTPPTPTGNPVGAPWEYNPSLTIGDAPVWFSTNEQTAAGVLVGPYTAPAKLGGEAGLSYSLSKPQIVLTQTPDGIAYGNARLRWVVTLGATDISDQPSYTLSPEVGVTASISVDGEIQLTEVDVSQTGSSFEMSTEMEYAGTTFPLEFAIEVVEGVQAPTPSNSITPSGAIYRVNNGQADIQFSANPANTSGVPTYAWSLTEVIGNVSYADNAGKDVTVRTFGNQQTNQARLRCVMDVDGQTITTTSNVKKFVHENPII